MADKNKILNQLKLIIINTSSIYIFYLIQLAFALILHRQAVSTIILLAIFAGISSSFFSLKRGLHPVSVIISIYFFQVLNLSSLNSKHFLKLYIESPRLALAALFIEPWLAVIISLIASIYTYRKYLANKPPERKIITYE